MNGGVCPHKDLEGSTAIESTSAKTVASRVGYKRLVPETQGISKEIVI